ncbi:MAG: FeS-binding protein [Dehalococcoidia bacterium]|nr:FeS-binding protein [Dehalococcoidia bacterium]MQG15324.1 FeS-binding protein [SAR202 cluster bacterium]|tara:strand:- start:651 stop:893 length:243 start_codon:yes stop_codon:yes gene_type:complete
MPIKRVKFTYEQEMIKEPIISMLSKDFDLVTNIRRADVREDMGWVVLEIEGDENEIQKALDWVATKCVRVDPISGDVVEG